MYPKCVIDRLRNDHPEWLDGITDQEHPLAFSYDQSVVDRTVVEDWLVETGGRCAEIKAYLEFLRRTCEEFEMVKAGMGYWNAHATHSLGHDRWSVGWAGVDLMPVANYIYVLRSYGVPGSVLECGAYKGSSSACLSRVCHRLEVKFFCADSFQGLPSAEDHYGKGDFHGTLEEVKANINRFGNPASVQFIDGWYSSSLSSFQEPLALIWIDVDLQNSVMDILTNVMKNLAADGVIFSDGFTAGVDLEDGKIRFTGGEPAGFHRFFQGSAMDYIAMPAGPKGLALIVPEPAWKQGMFVYPQRFSYLLNKISCSP